MITTKLNDMLLNNVEFVKVVVRWVQLPKVPVHLPVWSQVSIHVWRVM